jgi:nitrogenase molybdenum-iron protein beta chain
MISAFGIQGSVTINHGSQGCATYPRHQMARHFREPIEVATSSLTEKTTVYGGKENLVQALYNVYERFNPTMITICSTCLSETIGDDVPAIIEEFQNQNPDADIPILSVRTPSYVGTHITGFDNFLKEVAKDLPIRSRNKGESNGKVNILPGWVNPGDIRELKALMRDMEVPGLFITDYSDTLDGGYYQPRPRFPKGGTTVEELRDSSNSLATIALQKHVGGEAAKVYKKRHNVPAHILPMPIGLHNTDRFLETLTEITGKTMPESIETDRARLLDAIVDTHMFNSGLKVAIYGDPDVVEGLVRLTAEMGMEPKFALTATESKAWGEQMLALSEELGLDMEIMHKCDLHELHKRIKATPVSLLIGHSKGKFLADDEDIPLLRVGFPVEDRFGYHRRAIVGYRGAIQLVDEITNLILEKKSVVSNTVMEKEATGLYDDIPLLTTMGGGCGSGNGSCGG